ncbi:MAG: hypothetical protein ABIZ70_15810 [Gemmatimonadales bacterium]
MSQLIRRSGFANTLLLATTVLSGALLLRGTTPTAPASAPAAAGDAWLTKLTAKHRQLFDTPTSNGGMPLVHLMNYYDTWNMAYAVPDKEINGVLTFYGATTFHGLSDAMWAKYQLGAFINEKDAAGTALTANPWRTNPTVLGMQLPKASIESMQKRGATFLICNNALTIFAGLVAKSRGLDAAAVYADMKANILPNVTLVPGMVVAIEQAQRAGLTYQRQ